jgi:hypothetical protein
MAGWVRADDMLVAGNVVEPEDLSCLRPVADRYLVDADHSVREGDTDVHERLPASLVDGLATPRCSVLAHRLTTGRQGKDRVFPK